MKTQKSRLILAAALLLPATAACTGGRPWESRVPEREPLPEPPERLLRKPPDFRLRTPDNRREFLLFFYEDAEYREEVVLTSNLELPEAEQRPRLATLEEHAEALRLFADRWARRSDEEKLHYFNEIHLQELRRNATLLDPQIRFKEAAWRDLLEQKIALEADLKSRRDTNVFPEGSEKFSLISSPALEGELARVELRLAQTRAELEILRQLRAARDAEFGREAAAVFVTTAFPVSDLLPRYSDPRRLADQVRAHVRPPVWNRPLALLEIRDRHLVVRQTQDVLQEVERYLEDLREEFESRR